MTIRLVYYSEELDTEVTVYVEEDIDIEELEPKNCIFTGEPIDCLLYTSPSPRDRTRSRMPSSA